MNYKDKGLFAAFLFSVFILAIIKIENSDAWTHLSIGREIFNLRGFPETEPFTYPMLGKHFAYASWLFGLVLYAAYHAFNVYGVITLKAVAVTTAFYILTRDSLQPYKNYITAIGVMTVVVIMARPRFVERPDIFIMAFLSFSVYSLNAFLYENKKYIYLLPLVHLVWANMHTSINLMFIPFLAFIAGGMLQVWAEGREQRAESREQGAEGRELRAKIKTIAFIFLASFALSLVNPYFISQYTAGADFISLLMAKQAEHALNAGVGQVINIIELQRPRWQIIKWPYLMSLAVLLSFVLNWAGVYYSRSTGTDKKYPSLIHLFLVLPFIVLSFTAMRFIPMLGIITGPVLARNLSGIFEGIGTKWQWPLRIFSTRAAAALTAVWIVLYTALALAGVTPFGDSRKQFGFGVNYGFVPEGALRYMDKRNITGRMFNLFHWGQYITWRDFPVRMAFSDGRFSLPGDLLEKANIAQSDVFMLDELAVTYGFESVLIGYPLFNPHDKASQLRAHKFFSHPDWALVYWDDLSLLYLKRGGRYDYVIAECEYRFLSPVDEIYNRDADKALNNAAYRDDVIKELRRNISETNSSRAYAFLGVVYNNAGMHREAIKAFSNVRDFQPISHLYQAYSGMAYAYGRIGNTDESVRYLKKAQKLRKDVSGKAQAPGSGEEHFKNGIKAYSEKKLALAAEEFKKSIEANPLNPAPYSNLGYIYYETGNLDLAYENHKKAIDMDRDFANSYYGLALVYKKWGNAGMAKKQWEEYLRLEPTGPYAKKAREDIEALSR